MDSHRQNILDFLHEHGSITPNDAIYGFSCTRLSAYICIFRKEGMTIRTVIEHGKNKYGRPSRWARYYLEDNNDKT